MQYGRVIALPRCSTRLVRDVQPVNTKRSPEEGDLKVGIGIFAEWCGAPDPPLQRAKRDVPEICRLVDDIAVCTKESGLDQP
jgi:hypothetical protein